MDLSENSRASSTEGEWYDDIKYALLKRELKKLNLDDACIVDVGCGQGGILIRIKQDFPSMSLLGVDPHLTSEMQRNLETYGVSTSINIESVESNSADLILMMDVLEHVEKPSELLQQGVRLAKSSSSMFISVPAYRWLWSTHDVALAHVDRYTVPRLKAIISDAGFKHFIDHTGYSLITLLIGAIPGRVVEKFFKRNVNRSQLERTSESKMSGVISALAKPIGVFDASLFGGNLPCGLTCVASLRIDK